MKRLLSRMLHKSDAERERRLLEKAMGATPGPAAPEGLKERLIAEAIAASEGGDIRRPARSRAWLAWATAVMLVAIIAGTAMRGHRTNEPSPIVRAPSHSVPIPPKPLMVQEPQSPPAPRPAPVVRHRRTVRRELRRKPRVEAVETHAAVTPEAEPPVATGLPVMRVTVTRTREGGGYAQASAWGVDDAGNPVKTQWTVAEDASTQGSSQELTVIDAQGRRQSLMVAVARREDVKGEQL